MNRYWVMLDCRYVEWICRAEDLVLAEDRTTEDDRKLIMEARQKAAEKMKKLSKTNKNDSVETNSLDETEGRQLKATCTIKRNGFGPFPASFWIYFLFLCSLIKYN